MVFRIYKDTGCSENKQIKCEANMLRVYLYTALLTVKALRKS